jgi:hypothetical protein
VSPIRSASSFHLQIKFNGSRNLLQIFLRSKLGAKRGRNTEGVTPKVLSSNQEGNEPKVLSIDQEDNELLATLRESFNLLINSGLDLALQDPVLL